MAELVAVTAVEEVWVEVVGWRYHHTSECFH